MFVGDFASGFLGEDQGLLLFLGVVFFLNGDFCRPMNRIM